MKVVLDARWIPERFSGIGFYTSELIRALAAEEKADPITLLFHRRDLLDRVMADTGAARAPSMSACLVRGAPEHPISQFTLPRLLRRLNADVYHTPNYLLPLAAFPAHRPGSIRCVTTLHDLIPLRFPGFTPRALKTRYHFVYQELIRACAARTDLAIVPSLATQRDVQDLLGFPPNRIRVTPEAAGAAFTHDPSVRREPGEILFVGRADPYKNLTGLLDAFARIWKPGRNLRLRVIGAHDPRYPEARLRAEALGLGSAVQWDGYATGADLVAAYRRATLLAFPSLYEGFGLPVLEAMACGAPVVCSNRGSLPEVAGTAALQADPENPAAFAAAIERVLSNPHLAADLSARGLRRAAEFTWLRTARQTRAAWADALLLAPASRAKGRGA
jgi:glycosyltransferase involved in cell wall biosynthesis